MLTRALLLCPIGLFTESPFDQPMKPEERTVIEYEYIFSQLGDDVGFAVLPHGVFLCINYFLHHLTL